jgi:hypothetical protein
MIKLRIVERTDPAEAKSFVIQKFKGLLFRGWRDVSRWDATFYAPMLNKYWPRFHDTPEFDSLSKAQAYICCFDGTEDTDRVVWP